MTNVSRFLIEFLPKVEVLPVYLIRSPLWGSSLLEVIAFVGTEVSARAADLSGSGWV